MAFELGKEKRGFKNSKNVRIIEKNLDDGVKAEANNDGSIYVDPSIVHTKEYKKIIDHEMDHMKRMDNGELDYGDDWVMWEGNLYLRRTINGEAVIDGPNGRHPDGSDQHPWEQEAIQAEKE